MAGHRPGTRTVSIGHTAGAGRKYRFSLPADRGSDPDNQLAGCRQDTPVQC